MIHLGLDAVCWRAALVTGLLTLEGVIEEAASLEATHLQLNLGTLAFATHPAPGAVAGRLREHGLGVRVTGAPLASRFHGGPRGAREQVLRDLDAAVELGSRSLMVYLGVYRPELLAGDGGVRAEVDSLTELLLEVGPLAAERGLRLELENASDFRTQELEDLFAAVASESVGLFLDLTNPYNVLEDPVDTVRRLAPHAVGGHVKDFVMESIYTPDGYHRRGVSLMFRCPGEGISDVPGSLAALQDVVGPRDFHLAIEGLDTDLERPVMKERLRTSLAFLRAHLG